MTKGKERYWARHYLDEWSARSGDPRLPHWLRVAALAYGHHETNGHATFKRGEIALVLGAVDTMTGEIVPYANVRRAIDHAVEYGWLAEGSYYRCLIVPAHAIKMGELGLKRAPCPLSKHHDKKSNRSLSERNGVSSSTLSERFKPRTAHSVSGSPPEPFSSLLYHPTAERNPKDSPTNANPKEAS